MSDSKNNSVKTFDKTFYRIFVSFILLIVLILCFPFLFTSLSWFDLDFTETGNIGDTIGGIAGPFIAIAAAILTFFAFWVQYKANEQQKYDLKKERFENKFYNLLSMHRNNASEITIGNSTQRQSFVPMFNELKFLYLCAYNFYNIPTQKQIAKQKFNIESVPIEDIYNICYFIFFFGIGINSTKMILSLVNEGYRELVLNFEKHLIDLQINWKIDDRTIRTIEHTKDGKREYSIRIKYKPFNGHMSFLSHYVRHLFQMVKFVDDQPESLLNYEDKYNYIATVRAQLSTHEQLLLYYNALSALGAPWIEGDDSFLKKYCIIKSIPIPLADFFKKPRDIFDNKNKHLKQMFEWDEIQARVADISNSN